MVGGGEGGAGGGSDDGGGLGAWGVARAAAERSGVERSGAEWSGVERSGADEADEAHEAEPSGVERSGASGVERSQAELCLVSTLFPSQPTHAKQPHNTAMPGPQTQHKGTVYGDD